MRTLLYHTLGALLIAVGIVCTFVYGLVQIFFPAPRPPSR